MSFWDVNVFGSSGMSRIGSGARVTRQERRGDCDEEEDCLEERLLERERSGVRAPGAAVDDPSDRECGCLFLILGTLPMG